MSQLHCGAAKRCITPPMELLPRLIGLKQHRFAGVLDDIHVRAAVFESGENRLLLLGFDLNTPPCPESFLERLARETGIPEETIFCFAIHSHTVPITAIDLPRHEPQDADTIAATDAYSRFVCEEALEAVREALERLAPARMGWAFGESSVNCCRLQDYTYRDASGAPFTVCNLGVDLKRVPDRTLFTLKVEDMNGAPILFLVNYPMHNVSAIWNDFDGVGRMGISADIGGGVSRLLEAEYPGSVALWSSGAAGDLNPVMLNEVILPDPVTGRTYEVSPKGIEFATTCLKIMTERHYADIRETLSKLSCDTDDAGICGAVEWSRTPGVDCIRHHGAPPEFIQGPDVPEHTVRLHLARLGGLTLMGAGAEIYSSIGQAMMEMVGADAILITHDMSTLCQCHYILDDETIARCDASRGFAMVPGYDEYRCMAGVMKDDLCGHVRNLIQETNAR